ncbi:hypothetical protein JW805_09610 [Roseomonas aeriglobus]|nr:hypothetical protein [Roseomonas aeriglobus]
MPAYPINLRPSDRALELSTFVPHYRQRLNLAAGEFEGLQQNAPAASSVEYKPVCTTKAKPTQFRDRDGHLLFASFSRPLFSTHRTLAMVEVSFQTAGRFG